MTNNNLAAANKLSVLSNVTEITVDNADKVLSQLLELSDDTIDLSAITRCDSAGIAVLLEAKTKFSRQQRQVIFLNANQQLNDLATFLKVADLLFS